MNRFKFRAFISGSCYNEDSEDVEVSFLVHDVSVYNDGTVGMSRYDLEKAIEELKLSAYEKKTLWEYFMDNYETLNSDWFVIDCDKIEQCTGLKDKNGKFIYENDIVAVPYIDSIFYQLVNMEINDDRAVVEYFKGCFVVHYPEKTRQYLYDYETRAEVIGNIHETPELLEKSNDD